MDNLIVSIICGGSGTRLWPYSTDDKPKQFAIKINNESLFKKSLEIAISLEPKKIIIFTNETYRFFVKNETTKYKNIEIYLEPLSRNTTTPFLLTGNIAKTNNIKNFLVLPSDHVFENERSFISTIKKSIDNNKKITLFGIRPEEFDPNFGYIKYEENRIVDFIEKPKSLPADFKGNHLINSGIFLMNTDYFITTLTQINNKVYLNSKDIINSIKKDNNFYRISLTGIKKLPNKSIDYFFFEKIKYVDLSLKEIKSGWSDLGNWSRFIDFLKDKKGNILPSNSKLLESKNIVFISDSHKSQIAAYKLNNIFMIEKNNMKFITHLDNANELINLKSKKLNDLIKSQDEERPWGRFEILNLSDNFKIKKLILNPLSSISLQTHQFRAEHWIIIEGVAHIIKNKKKYILKKNESIYIPKKTIHKIENTSKSKILKIIEIQTGTYFGEDDIKRL